MSPATPARRAGRSTHHPPNTPTLPPCARGRCFRKALEALLDSPIDFDFDAYAVPGSPGCFKYDLSVAMCRYVLTQLINRGIKLVDSAEFLTTPAGGHLGKVKGAKKLAC